MVLISFYICKDALWPLFNSQSEAKNSTGWTFGRGRSQCLSCLAGWKQVRLVIVGRVFRYGVGVDRTRRDLPPLGGLIEHEAVCHLVGS